MNENDNYEARKTRVLHAGYERITPAPGKIDRWHCQICGSKADVRRHVNGPTGYAESMAKRGHLHDIFTCPNAGKGWHTSALKLLREMESTESRRLSRLIALDLQSLLDQNSGQKRH